MANFDELIIELSVRVLNGTPLDTDFAEAFERSLNEWTSQVKNGLGFEQQTVAALFDLASVFPTNKFGKLSPEKFAELEAFWHNATDVIRETLNS